MTESSPGLPADTLRGRPRGAADRSAGPGAGPRPVHPERVAAAYQALGSGDRSRIAEFYAEDLRWLVPGCHPLAGRYEGLDAFLAMMRRAHELTGGTFSMVPLAVMTGDGCSSDVCRNTALRAGADPSSASPYDRLDAEVFHYLTWRDGRIAEGRDGLFGDDATAFSQFWSPLTGAGRRTAD